MSGGPYGRGKAPERACLKLERWPAQDQALWLAALAPADPFADAGGSRHRYRRRSNRKVETGYGRWLTFLAGQELLDPPTDPADRITPGAVKAYVQELQALQNKKNTLLSRLQELGDMAKLMAPDRDWSFISRLASWLRAKPEAPRDKYARLVGSDNLYGLGLRLMAQVPSEPTPRLAALAFRDGLMIALLALIPLRRGNFVALTLGADLMRNGAGWSIVLPGDATKNHTPLEFDWPTQLVDALETYLSVHRPVLAKLVGRWATPVGHRLWVSCHGSPLTEMAAYDSIAKRTRAAFGLPLNPHLFRDAAATTTAIHDPVHVRLSAPLLGHRNFATTERYYQQAQSLEASRAYSSMITAMRSQPRLAPEPTPLTADAFGNSINPHLFQACAVTTIPTDRPTHIGIAAPVLGHSDLKTPEKHNTQANQLAAGRRLRRSVDRLRLELRPLSKRRQGDPA